MGTFYSLLLMSSLDIFAPVLMPALEWKVWSEGQACKVDECWPVKAMCCVVVSFR